MLQIACQEARNHTGIQMGITCNGYVSIFKSCQCQSHICIHSLDLPSSTSSDVLGASLAGSSLKCNKGLKQHRKESYSVVPKSK